MKTDHTTDADHLKSCINHAYHIDENAAVAELLDQISFSDEQKSRITAQATSLIETVRTNRKRFGGLDSFLQEFGLSTKEGIALMCLAEALLRIPDSETADKLIRDKIGGADWNQHIGKGPDLFVNASTWALMLTGKVIGETNIDDSDILDKMVARVGEPVIRRAMLHAMKILGQQFVMGRSIEEALKRAVSQEKLGYSYSYDMLGEGARTANDADRYMKSYEDAIEAIGKAAKGRDLQQAPGISIKLSALHPRYSYAQRERCVPELSAKLLLLAQHCAKHNIPLTVDAEEANRLEVSLEIIENVFKDPSLGQWQGFGLAVQAYQKRATRVIDWLIALADKYQRKMMVRLVKGAYWDTEIKYAQVMGFPDYPVFTRKYATDVSFLACAKRMMDRRDVLYPMFATHNAHSLAAIIDMAGNDTSGFEFQRLHGMGEPLYHQIVGTDKGRYPTRVYAPVGNHQDLLPYLVRRLLENGANSSFVNRLQNDKVPLDEMVRDPIDYIRALDSKPHPKIPLPKHIYGAQRPNAEGIEFANPVVSDELFEQIHEFSQTHWAAAPLIGGKIQTGTRQPVFDPSNHHREVGKVVYATAENIELALKSAKNGFPTWNATPVSERAACLRRMADLMEENMAELMALCIREAGKTLPDALAEVREAVDFCRYYAMQAEKLFSEPETLPGPTGELNQLAMIGRGTFLCISPWNFPLAIFIGQVTAALVSGNTVIAKPAEQTCLIAAKAVDLYHEAGIPDTALHLLPATGEMTGAHLVPDTRIDGVCFTGSTEVARLINKTLAERDGAMIPLIAETGGQNAMIADTSALPEQIVDDVISSAFHSAGQRCSALRVLYVQEDFADKVITMLKGACQELVVDDPIHLSTDIGPVIDEEARSILQKHADKMQTEAKEVVQVTLPASCQNGTFFAPRAYEIKSIHELEREVFGPVLHIIRFKGSEIDKVIDDINSTGYGLTFGLHTRIDHVAANIVSRIHVGNAYVNRNMTGAVVGVQPFGGQGLSGTGPKAGGPHYLLRFVHERSVCINTTASGGNTTLVSLTED